MAAELGFGWAYEVGMSWGRKRVVGSREWRRTMKGLDVRQGRGGRGGAAGCGRGGGDGGDGVVLSISSPLVLRRYERIDFETYSNLEA